MKIFDFFKNHKMIKQISTSLDTYNQLLEKSKTIKTSELLSILDSELETVAMGWIWGKFNEEWSNQYEIVSSLPNPCQNFYSCRTVSDEISNGGLNQLFFNSTREFAEMSIEGFSAVGSQKLSDVMKQAVELYRKNKSTLERYKDGTLESFAEFYEEAIFVELDDAFFCECDNVSYVSYIKEHIECFGDSST